MSGIRFWTLLTVCTLAASCAARGPSPQTLAHLARAEQLTAAGCYLCLVDALAIFERELAAGSRAPSGVAARAFGLVHVTQNAWPAATPAFSTAMACFVQASAQARRELAELEGSTDDPIYSARLAVDRRKAAEASDRKGAEAAYNAAQGYLRAGKRAEALGHLKLALDYPGLHTQAEGLRKLIEG